MTNFQGAPLEEQVKKLLEQNLAYSKELYRLSKKTQKYIFWGRIMTLISFLLIVIPLIFGAIFLPQFIKTFMNGLVPGGLETGNVFQDLLKSNNINQVDLLNSIQNQGGVPDAYKNIL